MCSMYIVMSLGWGCRHGLFSVPFSLLLAGRKAVEHSQVHKVVQYLCDILTDFIVV